MARARGQQVRDAFAAVRDWIESSPRPDAEPTDVEGFDLRLRPPASDERIAGLERTIGLVDEGTLVIRKGPYCWDVVPAEPVGRFDAMSRLFRATLS